MSRFPALHSALGIPSVTFSWEDVLGELEWLANHRPTEADEQLLLAVLGNEDDLLITTEDQHLWPHSMSPHDMAKSLAAQVLVKWFGAKHVEALRCRSQVEGSSLASLLRDLIERAEGALS